MFQCHPFVEHFVTTPVDVPGFVIRILDLMPEDVMMETSNS
jgi:hypothetical protein